MRGWAGLYAVTPDCSGIAGRVDGFTNLYEAHSSTGRGVVQSCGTAGNTDALVADVGYDDIDLAPSTRDRFADRARWVVETLHL